MAGNIILDSVTKIVQYGYKQVTGTTYGTKHAIDTSIKNTVDDPVNVDPGDSIDEPIQTQDWKSINAIECLTLAVGTLTEELESLKCLAGTEGKLVDGTGKSYQAQVTERGQLITAPLDFSKMYCASTLLVNTAYNIVLPMTGKNFIITDMILTTNKDVTVNGTIVTVYEASAADTTTEDTQIFEAELLKNAFAPMTGLNILATAGKWINIKATATIVSINIGGYYAETLGV